MESPLSADQNRFDRVKQLFFDTILQRRDQRESFLASCCGDDLVTREKVQELLDVDPEDLDLFRPGLLDDVRATVLWNIEAQPLTTTVLPERIGSYQVIKLLGKGAMGIVYEAKLPGSEKSVALKLVQPWVMSSELLRRRLPYEAELLRRLDHHGVASVYDAGTTDAGNGVPQPFFAMELIEGGESITNYVRRRTLSMSARLTLLAAICDAVHHAHQKRVIHRDIKPGNILVTLEGQPKVVDFGVGCAIDSEPERASRGNALTTMHTKTGELLGSMGYMSPEQAMGKVHAVDARSDIYSIGVLAFELLTDRLPYEVEGMPLHEAVRVVCTEEPPKLSTVDPSLKGDLETIVAKSLAKEPDRRYASAAELAADVRRCLDGETIAARPPSTWYQLSRFARRNRLLVSATALVFVSLVLGIVGTSIGLLRARAEKSNAVASAMREREAHAKASHAADLASDESKRAKRTLSDSYVNQGMISASAGDPALGLLYLSHALQIDEELKDPKRKSLNRVRWAEVLRLCPVWADGEPRSVSPPFETYGPWSSMGRFGPRKVVCVDRSGHKSVGIQQRDTSVEIELKGVTDATRVAFSRDWSKVAAIVGDDVQLFDASTGVAMGNVLNGGGKVVWFSGDAGFTRLLLINSNHKIALVDAKTGQHLDFPGANSLAHYAQLSPDGRIAAVGDQYRRHSITVVEMKSGGRTLLDIPISGFHDSVVFSEDSRNIAVLNGNICRAWDIATCDPRTPPLQHRMSVQSAAFSTSGDWLVTLDADVESLLRVWDLKHGGQLSAEVRALGTNRNVCFEHNNETVWLAGPTGILGIDLRPVLTPGHGSLREFEMRDARLSVNRAGNLLLCDHQSMTDWLLPLQLWDVPAGQLKFQSPPGKLLPGAWLAPSGQFLAFQMRDRESPVYLLSPESGKELRPPRSAPGSLDPRSRPLFEHNGIILGATLSDDGILQLYDVTQGKSVGKPIGPISHYNPRPIEFSPDGQLFAVWTLSTQIAMPVQLSDSLSVFDVNSVIADRPNAPLYTLPVSDPFFFPPDGRSLAVLTGFKLNLFNARDGKPARSFDTLAGTQNIFFSDDGVRAMAVSEASGVRIYDGRNGAVIADLPRAEAGHAKAALSPTGQLAATGYGDGVAVVWDANTGMPMTPPLRHEGPVADLRFSPDEQSLFTSSRNGPVRQWSLAPDPRPVTEMIHLAEGLSGRSMTERGSPGALPFDRWSPRWDDARRKYPRHFRPLHDLQKLAPGLSPETKPISYWSFDSPDKLAMDNSGGDADGLVVGTLASIDGVHGSAVRLEAGCQISVPDEPMFHFATAVSAGAWVRLPKHSGGIEAWVLGKWWGNADSFLLNIVDGTICFSVAIQDGSKQGRSVMAKSVMPADQWVHVIGVYDGKEAKLYMNGKLVASENVVVPSAAPARLQVSMNPILVGAGGSNAPTSIELDELMLFDVPLTPEQALALARRPTPSAVNTPTTAHPADPMVHVSTQPSPAR